MMLPLEIENLILKYKKEIDYGDVIKELEKEIITFKKYICKRKKINKKLSYYDMKRHTWKNKKLKYIKLKIVKYEFCEYCGKCKSSILNYNNNYAGMYFNIRNTICADCLKKIKYANIMKMKPTKSITTINYTPLRLPLGGMLMGGPF